MVLCQCWHTKHELQGRLHDSCAGVLFVLTVCFLHSMLCVLCCPHIGLRARCCCAPVSTASSSWWTMSGAWQLTGPQSATQTAMRSACLPWLDCAMDGLFRTACGCVTDAWFS